MNIKDIHIAIKNNSKLPFPYLIQLEVTNKCPFNCPQCYKTQETEKHMSLEELKDIIRYCYERGTRLFVLNGGEPLLYNNIERLLVFLQSFDVRVNCFTSGYGLTQNIVDIWNFDKFNLCVSLNGSTKSVNDLSREGYEISMTAIKMLSSQKKRFGINWVARHNNIFDFKNILDLAKKYAVGFIYITSEKLTSYGMLTSPLTEMDYLFLSKAIIDDQISNRIIIESCFPTLNNLASKTNNNYFMGCFAGRYGCHISVDFKFSPCTHISLFEQYESIEEYWNKSEIIKKINSEGSKGKCNICAYKNNCISCKAWDIITLNDLTREFSKCPIALLEV